MQWLTQIQVLTGESMGPLQKYTKYEGGMLYINFDLMPLVILKIQCYVDAMIKDLITQVRTF